MFFFIAEKDKELKLAAARNLKAHHFCDIRAQEQAGGPTARKKQIGARKRQKGGFVGSRRASADCLGTIFPVKSLATYFYFPQSR